MNAETLVSIRKAALWTAILSAAVLLLLSLIEIWGETGSEFLGKLTGTAAIVSVISGGVLLSLLVSSATKREGDEAAPAAAKKPATKK